MALVCCLAPGPECNKDICMCNRCCPGDGRYFLGLCLLIIIVGFVGGAVCC